MKRTIISLCLASICLTPAHAAAFPFIDVPAASPDSEAIQWLYESGYSAGDGKGHFMPDSSLSVQDSLYLLSAASGKPIEGLEAQLSQSDRSAPVLMSDFYDLLLDAYGIVPDAGETFVLDPESGCIFALPGLGQVEEDGQAARGLFYQDSVNDPTYTFPDSPITRADAAVAIYFAVTGQLVQNAPEVYAYMDLHLDEGYGNGLAELFRYADMIPDAIWKQFHEDGWVTVYGNIYLGDMSEKKGTEIRGLHTMVSDTVYVKYPEVICHEMGHWIYYVDDVNWVLGDCFEAEREAAAVLFRPYASINKPEFFADAFSYFVRYRGDQVAMEQFKNFMPSVYSLLLHLEETGWLEKLDWDKQWPV